MRDALPPARDLFGDEGAAAFLQTEQSYDVQLPSSASSMGSSPCESPRLELRTAAQASHTRRPLTGPALGQITRARPTRTSRTRCSRGTRAVCRDLRLERPPISRTSRLATRAVWGRVRAIPDVPLPRRADQPAAEVLLRHQDVARGDAQRAAAALALTLAAASDAAGVRRRRGAGGGAAHTLVCMCVCDRR